MTACAITINPPVIGNVVAGRCTALRRPAGGNLEKAITRAARPARQLWIREPFHLPARFDHLAPNAALAEGARPIFPDDARVGCNADIGPRRIPYTLPREAHRAHLLLLAWERHPLWSISDEEIAAEGWPDRAAYALAWDRALLVCGSVRHNPNAFALDPEVLVLRFEFVAAPAPADQPVAELA